MSFIDSLIVHADQALRTLVPGSVTPAMASPADSVTAEPPLTTAERQHVAGLMRINHCGEVCAQALYQGQSLTARDEVVRQSMQVAADEEYDHLAWCESRLQELDSRPSLLNPLFYGLSFGIGAMAGLIGDKWSLGFVAETEEQVCEHLRKHLQQLPAQDQKSRSILERMLVDEDRHAINAHNHGAATLPEPIKHAMRLLAQAMKRSTYKF
jgi:3-demethoxyubiquinol 3-hydroxylase